MIKSLSTIRPVHFLLFFYIALAIPFLFCATAQSQNSTPMKEGWIDDDTYRVYASGVPKISLTNKIQRTMSAKEAAKVNAQSKIMQKLMGDIAEYYSRVNDYCSPAKLNTDVAGAIKGGTVLDERFDDQDKCTILYEVKSPGLKKMVTPPFPCNWGQ